MYRASLDGKFLYRLCPVRIRLVNIRQLCDARRHGSLRLADLAALCSHGCDAPFRVAFAYPFAADCIICVRWLRSSVADAGIGSTSFGSDQAVPGRSTTTPSSTGSAARACFDPTPGLAALNSTKPISRLHGDATSNRAHAFLRRFAPGPADMGCGRSLVVFAVKVLVSHEPELEAERR